MPLGACIWLRNETGGIISAQFSIIARGTDLCRQWSAEGQHKVARNLMLMYCSIVRYPHIGNDTLERHVLALT